MGTLTIYAVPEYCVDKKHQPHHTSFGGFAVGYKATSQ